MNAINTLRCVAVFTCCCCCWLQIAAATDAGSCTVSVGDRKDCGYAGITREKCITAPGCCWDDTKVGIWCFHGTSAGCNSIIAFNRVDSSAFFNKTWADFKKGFGKADGNYWIGNDLLHELTATGKYKLSIFLQYTGKAADIWYLVEYSTFAVAGEADKYKLTIGGYSSLGVVGDGLSWLNGMAFTTNDRDNDNYIENSVNCAAFGGGGFWYNKCCFGCLTTAGTKSFYWHDGTTAFPLSQVQAWLTCL